MNRLLSSALHVISESGGRHFSDTGSPTAWPNDTTHSATYISSPDNGSAGSIASVPDAELQKYGISQHLLEYVESISKHPRTFRNFTIDESTRACFVMTEARVQHARIILQLSPAFARLRYKLCPAHLTEEEFWMVYFLLASQLLRKKPVSQPISNSNPSPQSPPAHLSQRSSTTQSPHNNGFQRTPSPGFRGQTGPSPGYHQSQGMSRGSTRGRGSVSGRGSMRGRGRGRGRGMGRGRGSSTPVVVLKDAPKTPPPQVKESPVPIESKTLPPQVKKVPASNESKALPLQMNESRTPPPPVKKAPILTDPPIVQTNRSAHHHSPVKVQLSRGIGTPVEGSTARDLSLISDANEVTPDVAAPIDSVVTECVDPVLEESDFEEMFYKLCELEGDEGIEEKDDWY